MAISDIDEATYSFIIRSIFNYLKKTFGIDLEATQVITPLAGTTTSSIVVSSTVNLLAEQEIISGTEISYITSIDSLTSFSISPSFTTIPTTATVHTTLVPFELQYAIYQHAKFLFEVQTKNINIVSGVHDSVGGRVSYKDKLPMSIINVYREYSANDIAFI